MNVFYTGMTYVVREQMKQTIADTKTIPGKNSQKYGHAVTGMHIRSLFKAVRDSEVYPVRSLFLLVAGSGSNGCETLASADVGGLAFDGRGRVMLSESPRASRWHPRRAGHSSSGPRREKRLGFLLDQP